MKKIQLNRFMVTLCAMLTLSFTSAWAITSPYVATPSGTVSAKGGEITLADVAWTYGSANYLAISNQLFQIGSKNNPQTTGWTISTPISSFGSSVTITKVKIAAKTGEKGSFDISVGGASVLSDALTTTLTDYETSTLSVSSGSIDITITGETKAAYLGTITVTFTKSGTDPELSVSPSSINFGEVEVGTESVEGKEITVTIENIEEVLIGLSTESPFQMDKESLTESGTVTVTPTAATLAAVGEYKDTLVITDADQLTELVPVAISVTEPVGPAPKGYTLVKNASALKAGDKLILATAITNGEKTSYYAAGAFGSNKFFSSTDATVSGDEISAPEAIIITLGGATGAWTFTTSEGLVGTKAAKALVLDDKDATTTWTISIDESNNAIITSTGEGLGAIQFNPINPRFLNYASAQKPVQLYRLKKGTTTPTPVKAITAVNAKDTVAVGDAVKLNYTIAPDTATDQRVEFAITSGAEFATLNNGTLTGVAAGDVVVTATALDSLNKSDKLSTVFEIHVKAVTLNTCAEANAAAKDTKLRLNEVTVVYVNGSYVYVKDASGSTLIFMSESGLKAGDVVSGIVGTASPYYGLPELKPTNKSTDWTITAGEAPAIPEATAAPTAAEVNQVMVWKSVEDMNGEFTTSKATNLTGTFEDEEILFRNNFKLEQSFQKGNIYDMTGAVAIYTKDETTTIQVYFISAKDVTPTAIVNAKEDQITAKKIFSNGQVRIVKDGRIFNVLGTELK